MGMKRCDKGDKVLHGATRGEGSGIDLLGDDAGVRAEWNCEIKADAYEEMGRGELLRRVSSSRWDGTTVGEGKDFRRGAGRRRF